MSTTGAQQYFVIPLSVQKEADYYMVGNNDIGDFYQFPEQGVRILSLLRDGETAAAISARLEAEYAEKVDVGGFIDQLSSIGFVHPEQHRQSVMEQIQSMTRDRRRVFSFSPRVAGAIFSVPGLLCGLAVVFYSAALMIMHPELRVNFDAFYVETNRTALLLVMMILTVIQVAMHETGHMMAAARHGIQSRYGMSNRLWSVVAESDLTGILALPRSQRYLPMLVGIMVDILCVAMLTILLQVLLRHGIGDFTIQVVQALVLEIVVGMTWQFNIFIKTDIYFVICNYFGHPDLDQDARVYLRDLLFRASFGLFGSKTTEAHFRNLYILRVFSIIWLFGRILAVLVLFGVFLPTMAQYIQSSIQLLRGSPASVWIAVDTIIYVSLTMSMLGLGMYMWIKQR
jgi:putative peptide zinc metalloprotease protein